MPFRQTLTKVRVVTINGIEEFPNLIEAKNKYPSLDPYRGCKKFTTAMDDIDAMRFESWDIHSAFDTED